MTFPCNKYKIYQGEKQPHLYIITIIIFNQQEA